MTSTSSCLLMSARYGIYNIAQFLAGRVQDVLNTGFELSITKVLGLTFTRKLQSEVNLPLGNRPIPI